MLGVLEEARILQMQAMVPAGGSPSQKRWRRS